MYILVTGGAGFIGSNFIEYYLQQHPDVKIVNLDLLTYAAHLQNLESCNQSNKYSFVHGDICDRDLVKHLFEHYNFEGVIHFAAESHVDNSIKNPSSFVTTNINGTFTLLSVAQQHWMKAPFKYKRNYEHCRFLHISTDEVYGTLGKTGYFTEQSPYAPNSPYSASKAASDFLVRSYYHTYGLNVVTTNCSNNYGPRQHDEKFIPTIIRKAISFEPIPIYGTGLNIRDWLYVKEHCRAIDLVFNNGKVGETYLIGGSNEHSNMNIALLVCSILDELLVDELQHKEVTSFTELIEFVNDREGHDFRYAIDASKIKKELGWFPQGNFEVLLRETILYYLDRYQLK
ncbi:dTDP-glucose 4,6-dehydratase [Paenibacillus montaniterrae]|uniref:dTDP-glucose 4,6-dehydratase n=1 Tax=Paenibacillus montaniterrae TaxID=429341 RepID=A0A919YR17_9BACL|nr:dTDP-glucose 4,6-dehydratase [Paenibacillus montaniterrae]GIP19112.1 dTDP-glucose 4,6-dehydratase [Paenibacillus montaniterrae]